MLQGPCGAAWTNLLWMRRCANTAALHAAGVMRVALHFGLRSEDEKAHLNWTGTDAEAEAEEGSPQLVMCDSSLQRANIGAPNSRLGCRSISDWEGATLTEQGDMKEQIPS